MGQVEGPFVTYRYGHVVSQKCLQYIFKLLQDFQYIQKNFETTYNEFFDQYFIVVNQNNSSFAIISFFHQFLNLRFHFTTVFTMFIYPSFLLRKMHTNIIIIIIIIITIIKNPQLIKRIRLTHLRLVSESTMRVSMGLTVSSKTA